MILRPLTPSEIAQVRRLEHLADKVKPRPSTPLPVIRSCGLREENSRG